MAVLKAGKIPPQRVATLTGINRTTVYSISKKLQEMGLVIEDLGQKVVYLTAISPENLVNVFEKEEKKIIEKKKIAVELTKELSELTSEKNYSVPRIKFVEEGDLSAYLYEVLPRWQESLEEKDKTWWGFHDNSFTENYGDWIDWSWKQYPNVFVRFFTNESKVEQDMKKKHSERLVKSLPAGTTFDSSLWIAGDYILMVQTRVRPHYLVEIYDEVLARNQRELFKGLWNLAPELS